jgi:hypothetical protein
MEVKSTVEEVHTKHPEAISENCSAHHSPKGTVMQEGEARSGRGGWSSHMYMVRENDALNIKVINRMV